MAGRRSGDKGAGRRGPLLRAAAALALLLTLAGPAAAQVPPDAPWRTLDTEHFRITFPAHLEELARRAGGVAEAARAELASAFREPPDERVELLLTDHVDISNGFARLAPYARVTVYARPPVDGSALIHFDDWMELVVTHELAHIVHLGVTGPLGRVLQGIFGRVPATWPFFPQQASPTWLVEGIATWYESRLTDAGRGRGTAFPMFLRTSALAGELESVDRASAPSARWPGGQRPYLYGSLFFDWLLERHGTESLNDFVDAVANQWVPFRLNAAAAEAFGESFSEAWELWTDEVGREAEATAEAIRARSPDLPEPELLTSGARRGLNPRVSRDGARLLWASADGRSDTRIVEVEVEVGPAGHLVEPGEPRPVTRTNGLSTFDVLPDGGIVFSQWTLPDPWRIRGDLFVRSADGDLRQVTRSARLDHPSAAPDGSWAAAVRTGAGRTELVTVSLDDGTVTPLVVPSDTVVWAYPRVSPDGRWIAASRWLPGARLDVVVVDARTGDLVAELTDDRAVDLAPTWGPDGWLVWGSDRSGIPNLYGVRLDDEGRPGALRQFTDIVTGVAWPDIDPSGRWIHVSTHTHDGWEVARLPFDPARTRDPVPVDPRFEAEPPAPTRPINAAPVEAEVGPYRPLSTLTPRHWSPLALPEASAGGRRVLGPFLGVSTAAEDVVGRHALQLALALSTTDALLDGRLAWSWRGLGNPIASLALAQEWDAAGPLAAPDGSPLFIRERERRVEGRLEFLRPDWRAPASLTLSAGLTREERTLLDGDLRPTERFSLQRPAATLGDLRASVTLSTARRHELSISPEDGLTLFARGRWRPQLGLAPDERDVAGRDRSVREFLAQGRGYLSFSAWGWADHVVAVRGSLGMAGGPGADAFWFDVGGAQGQGEPLTGLSLFGGSTLFFPARGFVDGDRFGNRAWSVSGEWRMPLAWVNRGLGLLPVHLDTLTGALFADAANAWGPTLGIPGFEQPRLDPLVSVGVELDARVVAVYSTRLQLRFGVAHALASEGAPGRGTSFYLRLGPSF